jgi:hypothetical protein
MLRTPGLAADSLHNQLLAGEDEMLLNLLFGVLSVAVRWLPRTRWSKVVGIFALCVGAWGLAYVFPLELALLMAGDWAIYFEILAAVGLIAANTHARSVFRKLILTTSRATRLVILRVRVGGRSNARVYSRSHGSRRRVIRPRRGPGDDDAGRVPAFA